MTSRLFGRSRLELRLGDITAEDTDAIVNAANSTLMGGGGVDGAIHRAGGPAILEECRRIREARGPLPTGEAVITGAGRLKCRHVIHTVGPVWHGGSRNEPWLLARCYRSSLELAASFSLRDVAFPSISTGAFGYPLAPAAAVAVAAVRDALGSPSPPSLVRFVLFSPDALSAYEAALGALPG